MSEVPEPSSTKVSAAAVAMISVGVVGEDLAFGASRVVLVEAGDGVEQRAADLVVEPLGRGRLRCRRQAVGDVVAHGLGEVVGVEPDVDGGVEADDDAIAGGAVAGAGGTAQIWDLSLEISGTSPRFRAEWWCSCEVLGESEAAEHPAGSGGEEVAVGGAGVAGGGDGGAAAQDLLVDHELAVVFADGAGRGSEAGVRARRGWRSIPRRRRTAVLAGPVWCRCRSRIRPRP